MTDTTDRAEARAPALAARWVAPVAATLLALAAVIAIFRGTATAAPPADGG